MMASTDSGRKANSRLANKRLREKKLSSSVRLATAEERARNTLKGYLRKKSSKGTWQRRWFEASAHYLTYYKVALLELCDTTKSVCSQCGCCVLCVTDGGI